MRREASAQRSLRADSLIFVAGPALPVQPDLGQLRVDLGQVPDDQITRRGPDRQEFPVRAPADTPDGTTFVRQRHEELPGRHVPDCNLLASDGVPGAVRTQARMREQRTPPLKFSFGEGKGLLLWSSPRKV